MKRRCSVIAIAVSLLLLLAVPAWAYDQWDEEADDVGIGGRITYVDAKGTGDELLIIWMNDKGDAEQIRKKMIRDATPNAVKKLKTVTGKGITSLTVSAEYFGVVVEPVVGQDFVVDLVGVKNPEQVTLDTGKTGGNLSVNIKGDRTGSRLISTVADNRINTVRIGVPTDTLNKLELKDEGNGCILVNGLDIPVNGAIGGGVARVQSEQLTAGVTMKYSSGDVIVKAKEVSGAVKLSASSGDAVLIADTVTGKAELTASSGDVKVEVGVLHNAVLKASSGDVDAKVAEITGNVKATVSSGDLEFKLTRKPSNLRFVFDGNEKNDDVELPRGWSNGYTVGNGKPVLHLGVGSGELELSVG